MIKVFHDRPSQTGEDLQALLASQPELVGSVNWTGRGGEGLNSNARSNKLAQLVRLEHQGVPVPYFTLSKPKDTTNWLGRGSYHREGRDLTNPLENPDFWVSYLNLEEEWRLHFFRRKKGSLMLLRSGKKAPKSPKAHPWIRANRLGWKISYVGGAPKEVWEIGFRAINALQLDFGAVDIGVTLGYPVVLEVNTCPGLEGNTLRKYAEEITRYFEE
jgi:hypothetical protein